MLNCQVEKLDMDYKKSRSPKRTYLWATHPEECIVNTETNLRLNNTLRCRSEAHISQRDFSFSSHCIRIFCSQRMQASSPTSPPSHFYFISS